MTISAPSRHAPDVSGLRHLNTPAQHAPDVGALPLPLARLVEADVWWFQHRDAITSLGIASSQLALWTRAGHLRALKHGAYSIVTPAEEPPWRTAATQHLRDAKAVCDGLPGTFLVGRSAALAHGLPTLQVPHRLELSRYPALRTRRRHLYARRPWSGVPELLPSGLLVQGRAECVVETASLSGGREALVVANAALRAGVEPAEIEDAITRFGCRTGVTDARAVLSLADARIETPLESVVFWACHVAGIELCPQHVVRDGAGGWMATADFLVKGTRLLLEADGLGKYRCEADLRKEKVRELDIVNCGYGVLRATWSDADAPDRLTQRIHRAIPHYPE